MKIKNAKVGMRVQVKSDISKSLKKHGNCGRKENSANKYGEIYYVFLDSIKVRIDGGAIWRYAPEDLRIADKKRKCKNFELTFDWPDSFEEATEGPWCWGLYAAGSRYMVVMSGPDGGHTVNCKNTWALDKKDMDKYWGKKVDNGWKPGTDYYFEKFNSAKELYQWLSDGEE